VRLVVATVEACSGNSRERVLLVGGRVYDEEEGVSKLNFSPIKLLI
jgi:hypothetical protein